MRHPRRGRVEYPDVGSIELPQGLTTATHRDTVSISAASPAHLFYKFGPLHQQPDHTCISTRRRQMKRCCPPLTRPSNKLYCCFWRVPERSHGFPTELRNVERFTYLDPTSLTLLHVREARHFPGRSSITAACRTVVQCVGSQQLTPAPCARRRSSGNSSVFPAQRLCPPVPVWSGEGPSVGKKRLLRRSELSSRRLGARRAAIKRSSLIRGWGRIYLLVRCWVHRGRSSWYIVLVSCG